ncbi:MAG: AAA family ATPase [Fimbriimonadales bacterium]|nr:AAA family ATPase [Fimbriimonadales bacterium]
MEPTAQGGWWVRYGESTFHFRDDRHGLLVRLKNVRPDDGHILADLFAMVGDADGQQRPLLVRPRVNLTSDRSLPGLMRSLEVAGKAWGELQEYDWRRLLERMCVVLVSQMDQKGLVTRLARLEGAELAQPMLCRGIIPEGLLTGIVAHGGTGKSLTAAMLALAVATGRRVGCFDPLVSGPVLYVDWENDHRLHARRLTRLCVGAGLEFPGNILHYRAHASRFAAAESDVVELAYQEGAVLTIVDSVAFAAGGNVNDPDVATGTVNALKRVPGTKVMIAHVSKAAAAGMVTSAPAGSVFFWNGCQAVYDLRAGDPELDGSLLLALHHSKSNVGPRLQRPLAVRVGFIDPDGPIGAEPVEIRGDGIGGENLPLHLRIADALQAGALSAAELAERLRLEERSEVDQMGRALRVLERQGRVVALGEKPVRFGLAASAGGVVTSDKVVPSPEGPEWCPICGQRPYRFDEEGQGWCRQHWDR